MIRFYMKGKKILNGNRRLYATIEKSNERGRYDMYTANGEYMCSIFNYASDGGFKISSSTNEKDTIVYAFKKHVLQIGLGLRVLPKPIIPLADLPFGSYTGAFGMKSLVIDRSSIIVDGKPMAQYKGANTGYINAMMSGYTYLHQHIDISDTVSDVNVYVAIYAYLYHIR